MLLTSRVDVLALRASPGRATERVSEALLGEPLEARESDDATGDPWVRVCGGDEYEGWAPRRALVEWSKPSSERVVHTRLARVEDDDDRVRMLSLGCRVEDAGGNRVRLPDGTTGRLDTLGLATFYGSPDVSPASRARAWLGVAYRWGGRSVHGVDCSGLLQHVLRPIAPDLPRDAWQQEAWAGERCRRVARDDIRRGDLVFWGRDLATHVGIALDEASFVHAREWVRVGRWDRGDDADLAALHRGTYRLSTDASDRPPPGAG